MSLAIDVCISGVHLSQKVLKISENDSEYSLYYDL